MNALLTAYIGINLAFMMIAALGYVLISRHFGQEYLEAWLEESQEKHGMLYKIVDYALFWGAWLGIVIGRVAYRGDTE